MLTFNYWRQFFHWLRAWRPQEPGETWATAIRISHRFAIVPKAAGEVERQLMKAARLGLMPNIPPESVPDEREYEEGKSTNA